MKRYQTLVVPFDFSEHALAALREAQELARDLGASLHLVHVLWSPQAAYAIGSPGMVVTPPPIDTEAIREHAKTALEPIAAGLDLESPVTTHVIDGFNVADSIRACAAELGADLIVMGTHGRTGLAHAFLGSVAERVLRRAPCPVLTVRCQAMEA